jgi:hypothetical protein
MLLAMLLMIYYLNTKSQKLTTSIHEVKIESGTAKRDLLNWDSGLDYQYYGYVFNGPDESLFDWRMVRPA